MTNSSFQLLPLVLWLTQLTFATLKPNGRCLTVDALERVKTRSKQTIYSNKTDENVTLDTVCTRGSKHRNILNFLQVLRFSLFPCNTNSNIQPLATVAINLPVFALHSAGSVGKTTMASFSEKERKNLPLVLRNNEELVNQLSDLYMSAAWRLSNESQMAKTQNMRNT